MTQNRDDLLKEANYLIGLPGPSFSRMEEAEKLLLDYLETHEDDILMWYHLAILEHYVPLCDFERAIEYLTKIWGKAKDIKAIIYIAVIQDIFCVIEDDIALLLREYHIEDTKLSAMRWYCVGLYCEREKDTENAIIYLQRAIEQYPRFTRAYDVLGHIHRKLNLTLSKHYYKEAIKYVTIMKDNDTDYDWLSLDSFENEKILGNCMSTSQYKFLTEYAS